MQNIYIRNVKNGGFIIYDDNTGGYIAALSNSGDLIRWVTEQFIKPKTLPVRTVEVEEDGFVTEWTAYGDHAVVKP